MSKVNLNPEMFKSLKELVGYATMLAEVQFSDESKNHILETAKSVDTWLDSNKTGQVCSLKRKPSLRLITCVDNPDP